MSLSLNKWLSTSTLEEIEKHTYRAIIRIVRVPEWLKGKKFTDIDGHVIKSLRKEDILVVSLLMAKTLERMKIAEIIKEVDYS